jgi:BirA family biotin operon repressor/biotin-[acetyl-CoA-carboxylase] ligase
LYLKDKISNKQILQNTVVYTFNQTNGIGSRNNNWNGESITSNGSLFFSFCIKQSHLPKDLPLNSISLYFSYIFKTILKKNGSNVWLKWPNDFYIKKNKVGGCVTNLIKGFIVCGIGLNFSSSKFENIDICVDKLTLLKQYLRNLENVKKLPKWREIFSKYRIEFVLSKEFYTNINKQKVLLKNAILNSDGSLTINNNKVYNTR